MPPSDSHTTPTRRVLLAACGTAVVAGCSGLLTSGSSTPAIECAPGTHTWPMYGHSAGRTSHVETRTLPTDTIDAERFSDTSPETGAGGSIDAPPVVGDGIAYIAGDVRVEARDIETGARLWEADPEDSVAASPVLACGTVYVSTLNATLAFDPADGTLLWRADAGSGFGVSGSPVVVDDTLYASGNGVAALDAETGSQRWQVQPDHSVHGVAVTDRVYAGAASNGSGEVAAFTRSGEEWWRTPDPGEVYAAPAVADDTVYAVSKTGTVTALAALDGTVQWQAGVESGVHEPPAVADGRVVVEAGNGTRTVALDATTGDRLWTFETGVSSGAPVVTGDRVLATGANTGIHVLEAATGTRVHHWPVENVGSQPVVADGTILYRGWTVSDAFRIG